jgi:hypothetical protein
MPAPTRTIGDSQWNRDASTTRSSGASLDAIEIQVEGFQAKNGAKRANGRDLVLPDGRRLFLGSSGTGAPVDGRDDTEK